MRYFILISIVLIIMGCKQPPEKSIKVPKATHYDTVLKERAAKRQIVEREFIRDSIRQDSVIAKILQYANQHIGSTYTGVDLKIWSNSDISSVISFGNIFSASKKHLIVQNRVNNFEINENVFLFENNKFINVIKQVAPVLTMLEDTVRDVNGDHLKDFVLNWYPTSGCCMRMVYDVYIYQQGTGRFSAQTEFLNANFYPAEKLIRGVAYGHPGEVPIYKYKWNGANIDTIEYIYPADKLKKRFYRVRLWKEVNDPKKRMVLKAVPKEYRKMQGFDWFIDYP